jgi:alpha-N-arabinofuranosidase
MNKAIPLLIITIFSVACAPANEIHVSKKGDDSNSGGPGDPLLTISRAASIAKPGDRVVIHAGTYREWVKPPRGGTGENARITYCAAEGEKAVIKGSERIRSWKKQGKGVWKAELPNEFFGDYNPYALKLSGGWLNYGQWHHRGDVYLDGKAYLEKQAEDEVRSAAGTWHCRADEKTTTIVANFGDADPNERVAEINVRECLFMPVVTGLKYITIDGLRFMHAASNWAPPVIELQTGAMGTRMGKRWIIQNCTITDCRCVGIILGHAPGVDYQNIDAFGDHVVRNNIIKRCGQAGIAGQKGATRSLISGNFIEDTNYRKEFGGWETAAIKFHNSVDTVISDNLIRGVYHQKQGAFGIWIDYANQSIRVTGNIIYDTQAAPFFIEMNHGPILVDNNIFVGREVLSNSEATVFAHNLFVDCAYHYRPDTKRRSSYYKPHTTRSVGKKTGTACEDLWFNNIFVRRGMDRVKKAGGYRSDYNAFLEGAKKSSFGDKNSIVDSDSVKFKIRQQPLGAIVTFHVDEKVSQLNGPLVDSRLVGVFKTVGQTIADRHGKPIAVDRDINGRMFTRRVPGPLADLKAGQNTVTWSLRPRRE